MSDDLKPLSSGLASLDEAERYRCLATILTDLADKAENNSHQKTSEQMENLNRRVRALEAANAELEDQLRVVSADLEHRNRQLELEQERNASLQSSRGQNQDRVLSLQKEVELLEKQLTERSNDLHRVQVEKDDLGIRLQRAQLAAGDTSALERRDDLNRQLMASTEQLRAELSQLQTEKDAQIRDLSSQLESARHGTTQAVEDAFDKLWQRLASAEPPLTAKGRPTPQVVERMIDSFIELSHFAAEFDDNSRLFLSKYTRDCEGLREPWNAYQSSADFNQMVREIVSPQGSTSVTALRLKLRICLKWALSAWWSFDGLLENVEDELLMHLRGQVKQPDGTITDVHAERLVMTIRDFIRQDGPGEFMQRMRELCSRNLEKVYCDRT